MDGARGSRLDFRGGCCKELPRVGEAIPNRGLMTSSSPGAAASLAELLHDALDLGAGTAILIVFADIPLLFV